MKTNFACCLFLVIVLIISSCSPAVAEPVQSPKIPAATVSAPASTPELASVSLPVITLNPGDFYFSVDGKERPVFLRNVAAYDLSDYENFLDWSKSGGSSVARVQLNAIKMGYTGSGKVDEAWAKEWDNIFDAARSKGIYVLPVFSSWFDWNAKDNPYSDYSTWDKNKFNDALGGPAKSPSELFEEGSKTRTAWFEWVEALVQRWKSRDNIIGWEVFSEVNFISGATEPKGVEFVNAAAGMIRSVDPGRPVTASIADTGEWKKFYRDADIDFINIHPYPPSAQLDRTVVQGVRDYLGKFDRPVLIGESGLNPVSPNEYPENAEIGVRHAMWAGAVSGAMNGRGLYWEDSFGLFIEGAGILWMGKYKTAELPVSEFVKGVDFSGFKPLTSGMTKGVWGAAAGNESSFIGWFRDSGCEPPDYKLNPVISGQSVIIIVPGDAAAWQVRFYSTKDGTTELGVLDVERKGDKLTIPLPDFSGDIAFKANAK
ncbi:MAG: Sugar-binding cellulase-like protein [Firmicutes bacterium ADurb.Bin182]|nr:MAG: Sugar-binding cellulase-like protein [Firmicutes bacterium ADurb.Bin182]